MGPLPPPSCSPFMLGRADPSRCLSIFYFIVPHLSLRDFKKENSLNCKNCLYCEDDTCEGSLPVFSPLLIFNLHCIFLVRGTGSMTPLLFSFTCSYRVTHCVHGGREGI